MKTYLFLFVVLIFVCAGACFSQCLSPRLIGPSGVASPGEEITFRLDSARDDLKLSWTVSAGTIIKGQGTHAITVTTDRSLEGTNITATVEIKHLATGCANIITETVPIGSLPIGEPVDDWDDQRLRPDDRRGRLDAFFYELAMNPHSTGLIVFYLGPGERMDSSNKRLRFVLEHVRFRKFDKARIWFGLSRQTNFSKTVLWRFPPEAKNDLPCEECRIIKGGDLR